MSFVVQRRDGLFSIIKTARLLCKFIVAFAPRIAELYPTNTALQTALQAALIACQTLEEEARQQKELGV